MLTFCPVKLPARTIRGASPAVWRWFEAFQHSQGFNFVSCFILVATSSCVVSHFLLPLFVCSVSQHQSSFSSFSQRFSSLYHFVVLLNSPSSVFLLSAHLLLALLTFGICIVWVWTLDFGLLKKNGRNVRKWGGIPLCDTQDYTVYSRRTLQNLSKLLAVSLLANL